VFGDKLFLNYSALKYDLVELDNNNLPKAFLDELKAKSAARAVKPSDFKKTEAKPKKRNRKKKEN